MWVCELIKPGITINPSQSIESSFEFGLRFGFIFLKISSETFRFVEEIKVNSLP